MSWYLDHSQNFRSRLLDQLPWLVHGFGTRHAVLTGHPLVLQQIHSATVIDTRDWTPGCAGDALLSAQPGALLAVKTADCVPLLLVDRKRKAVAAIHAGWRGTVGGVVAETLRRMRSDYGSSPAGVLAAIGPAIGSCCFEVGPEVAAQFKYLFPERSDLENRCTVDLVDANRRILIQAGVPESQVVVAALCTRCERDLFYSWRRDQDPAVRLYSFVGIRA